MKTATAALLSAPRIVSPRLRKTPSSSTTSICPRCGTVSRWAQNITHSSVRPGRRARMLPAPASAGPAASSSLTSRPIARSSAATVSATSRSSPVGLRISQSRTKVSCSRELSSTADRLERQARPGRQPDCRTPTSLLSASSAVSSSAPSAGRSPAWCAAAPTNSRNSGSGRLGRELNSGWNWEATKKG